MEGHGRAPRTPGPLQPLPSFDGARSPWFRELPLALIRHLHALIRGARPTETERATAIDFLRVRGGITDDRRKEFVLLSDVLGLSMQTIRVNHPASDDATVATVGRPDWAKLPSVAPS